MTSVSVSFPQTPIAKTTTSRAAHRALTSKRVAFSTLGCKVNLFESELISEKLVGDHYQRVNFSDKADLYVINTCTVTAEADRQARQTVRRAVRQNPDAWVVVTGCYAQMDAKTCSEIPGVDLVVGNSQKLDIPHLLNDLYQHRLPPVLLRDLDKEISLPDQLLHGFEGRTRAFVQIQQGCDQACTFCIIHSARGPSRSFSAEMIKRQCERLIMNGYGEIVICGVDIGSYGADFAEKNFGLTELLCALLEIKGEYRLRLSSIDPAHITDGFIELLRTNVKICPQLHLSLQSANTLILKRMKRRATREQVYRRIAALRTAVPELVLSADIMVGFPTESDQHFHDTLSAVSDLEIAYPHVFTYSARPGTPASRIPSQVSKSIGRQRSIAVRNAGQAVWKKVASGLVGQRQTVLVESSQPHDSENLISMAGRASNYFPVEFSVSPGNGESGPCKWVEVEVTGTRGAKLTGRKFSGVSV